MPEFKKGDLVTLVGNKYGCNPKKCIDCFDGWNNLRITRFDTYPRGDGRSVGCISIRKPTRQCVFHKDDLRFTTRNWKEEFEGKNE